MHGGAFFAFLPQFRSHQKLANLPTSMWTAPKSHAFGRHNPFRYMVLHLWHKVANRLKRAEKVGFFGKLASLALLAALASWQGEESRVKVS